MSNSNSNGKLTVTQSPDRQEKTDELISYLDNIKETLEDELLNIFIQKYKLVLSQVNSIENEINRRCNEQ